MSKFYGTVVGQSSTCATRRGSAASGIKTACQSYDGSIICSMDYNDNDELLVRVGTSNYSATSSDWNTPDFVGSFEDFKKLLTLAKDIKEGKVSVVRHRAKSNKMLALERAFRD